MASVQYTVKTGLGQKSYRFLPSETSKPCVIGGVVFEDVPGFNADSDGDVVYHALCNAVTSLTGVPILGEIAADLYTHNGITDSEVYLTEAYKTLYEYQITHVSMSLEAKRPYVKDDLLTMRENVARIFHLDISQVGLTAISGAGLTDFGCGDGVQCFAIITVMISQQ